MEHIANRRQLFVDDHLIDKTTAQLVLQKPERREIIQTFDAPGDGNGTGSYLTLLHDAGTYYLYYLDWDMYTPKPRTARVLLSRDGIHWERPGLGRVEFEGSRDNNVVFDPRVYRQGLDNFIPFIDTNPACPPEAHFKALSGYGHNKLRAYRSPDGFSWEPLSDGPLPIPGMFDSSNLAFWDAPRERYCAYIRDFHDIPLPGGGFGDSGPQGDLNAGIRDIRVSFSGDFKEWTPPQPLDFGNAPDIPLYVSAAQPYFRAPEYFVGFPVRYVEHPAWSPAFDQLSNPEHRRQRMQHHPRYGLAVTDCLFMSSRDGLHWTRSDEAFLRPGPVCDKSWVYGDCYLSVGMALTPADRPGAPDEISLYTCENHWNGPKTLRRCVLRQDGFVALHAGGARTFTETGAFTFEGSRLELNLSTSACGFLRVALTDGHGRDIEGFTEADCDLIFGDRVDYTVTWRGSPDVSALAGHPVRLRLSMAEADVFSFKFT